MCCPEASSVSATSAISPALAVPLSWRSLVSSLLASLHQVHISPTPRQLLGVVRATEPICSFGPTSPRNNWRFGPIFPTLADSSLIQGSQRCNPTFPSTCVLSAKLRPCNLSLPASGSRNHSFPTDLSPLLPYLVRVFQPQG